MKPWVLIDLSFLAHRARYATAELLWEDFHTGILYGFWEQLRTICQSEYVHSNRVVLFFDSRQSYRLRDFPQYKSHRREDLTEEEKEQLSIMYDQIRLLRQEILPAVGFQICHQTGCESDDLMAQVAGQLSRKKLGVPDDGERGIIVTADGDLFQCITDYVSWFDPSRRYMYNPISFENNKGIAPDQWGKVKALAGCDGDGVPGIAGVGEKTAIKYLKEQLPQHHKTYQAIKSEEGQKIYARNKWLVMLPHAKTKPIVLQEPQYNVEAFFHYAERYGFLTYLKEPKRSEWEAFFNNKPIHTRRRGEGNRL